LCDVSNIFLLIFHSRRIMPEVLSSHTMCLWTICRESQSCSASNSDPNSKKRDKGIKELDGSFLTLAPPSPASLNNQESPEVCATFF
jgi:hypothetical protein